MSVNLFTGKIFPEIVLKKDFKAVLVFEFEAFFKKVFAEKLTEFCTVNDIKYLQIKSLDKYYPFIQQIDTNQIIKEYTCFLQEKTVPEELPNNWNYHMLISNFVLFSNKDRFAFYANRDFEIAVLAYDTDIDITMFKELILGVTMEYAFNKMRFDKKNSLKVIRQFSGKEYFFNKV